MQETKRRTFTYDSVIQSDRVLRGSYTDPGNHQHGWRGGKHRQHQRYVSGMTPGHGIRSSDLPPAFRSNLKLQYEWGHGVENEIETAVLLQFRYRFRPALEWGAEAFLGQDSRSVGPVLPGQLQLDVAPELRWGLGVQIGIGREAPQRTLRGLLEFEF